MNDDAKLLLRYAQDHSEAAFTELVQRHVDLVYSAALRRCTGDTHRAEDVVQQVFTSLAQGAEKLSRHPALSAWLYTATRNAATNLWVADQRRMQREQEAGMNGLHSEEEHPPDWSRVRPVLDDAMDELSETDRTAVLMRFFEKRSFAQIGAALNASENTARVRTERALEKLRLLLAKRGVSSPAAALGLVLAQQAVTAAPASVVVMVTETILGLAAGSIKSGGLVGYGFKTLFLILSTVAVLVAIYFHTRIAHADTARAEIASAPLTRQAGIERWVTLAGAAVASTSTTTPTAAHSHPSLQNQALVLSSILTAQEILKKMAAAYAALTSYQDSGEVLEKNAKGQERSRITFQTWFSRPDRFRFDWTATLPALLSSYTRSAMIWSDGGQAIAYSETMPYLNRKLDLPAAVVVNMSVTNGASYHVPRQLVGPFRQNYFSLAGLSEPQLAGESEVEGTLCYSIKGQHPSGSPYELWIGKNDFLLRKIKTVTPLSFPIRTERRPGESATLEEIHREIRTNGAIPDEIFRVKSPVP